MRKHLFSPFHFALWMIVSFMVLGFVSFLVDDWLIFVLAGIMGLVVGLVSSEWEWKK